MTAAATPIVSQKSSKPLTNAQLKYGRERIEAIHKERVARLTAQLVKPEAVVSDLTEQQKYDFLKAGKATLNEDLRKRSQYGLWHEFFEFPESAAHKKYTKAMEAYTEARDAIVKKANAEAQFALDRLMLSGSDEAMKVLEDFAKTK